VAQDLYEILEIPNNATDAWIRRGYESRRKAIGQDASLGSAEREAQLQAVEHAFGVLSDAAARAQYDEQLLAVVEPAVAAKKRSAFSGPRIAIYGTVLAILVGTGVALWRNSQFEERTRIEQERVNEEIKARVKEMQARDRANVEAADTIKNTVVRAKAKQEEADVLAKKAQEEKERAEALASKAYDPR
jgi:DnaJ-class molecular chaperone